MKRSLKLDDLYTNILREYEKTLWMHTNRNDCAIITIIKGLINSKLLGNRPCMKQSAKFHWSLSDKDFMSPLWCDTKFVMALLLICFIFTILYRDLTLNCGNSEQLSSNKTIHDDCKLILRWFIAWWNFLDFEG